MNDQDKPTTRRPVHPDALAGVRRYGGDLTISEQLRVGAPVIEQALMRFAASTRQVVSATTRTEADMRLLRDRLWASDEQVDEWRAESASEAARRRQLLAERRERQRARVAVARRAVHVAGEVLLITVLAGVLVFLLTWYAGG